MAMAECRKSLALDPNNVQSLLLEGEIFFRMGRYGEAAAAFRKVCEMYPSEEEAYTRLGNTYLLLGDYRDAQKAYTRSLAIRPGDPVVRENLETAMRLAGQESPAPAEETFENDTVKGTVPPTGEEFPVPAEIAALNKDETVPASFRTPTNGLAPALLLSALLVVVFMTRSEKDRR
jgi:tetratricopeptide (TPR) repeat protein